MVLDKVPGTRGELQQLRRRKIIANLEMVDAKVRVNRFTQITKWTCNISKCSSFLFELTDLSEVSSLLN